MAFWSGQKLLTRLQQDSLISPFDPKAIDCAAYTLSLGREVFTTSDDEGHQLASTKRDVPGLSKLAENDRVSIKSGQFALLLTEESVSIPDDALGFISVKARNKLQGLINVSGFHVDPGWSGPLIFGVFNAGPQELVLQRGQPLFLLFIADLDMADRRYVYRDGSGYTTIPPSMIQNLSGPVPSLYKLDKKATKLNGLIDTLTSRVLLAAGASTLALGIAGLVFTRAIFLTGPSEADIVELVRSEVQLRLGSPTSEASAPLDVPLAADSIELAPGQPVNESPTETNATDGPPIQNESAPEALEEVTD